MTDDEIVAFWTRSKLVTWDVDDLVRAGVPVVTTQFLRDVGLPVEESWWFRFQPSALLGRAAARPELRILGFAHEMPICVDVSRDGIIVIMEDEVGDRPRFLNQDAQRLAMCLVFYQRYRLGLSENHDEEHDQRLIDETEPLMRQADPAAFSDPDNAWPVLIEQMRLGMA